MSERTEVTNKIMDVIKRSQGMWGFKTHGNVVQGAGLPDIIACIHGRFVAVECKAPTGGRLGKLQEHILQLICRAGGVAKVCLSVESFEMMVAALWPSEGEEQFL